MRFDSPLEHGVLERRYKRFLADVVMAGGESVTAHVPNSGAMLGLDAPGLPVLLSRSFNPSRKLPLTLEMVALESGLVGVNTQHPNALVAEAITEGRIPALAGYGSLRREVVYDRDQPKPSRIDILLESEGRAPAWVEVKNVHLSRTHALAEFPDCRTERGVKHLHALTRVAATGGRAVMVFCVQRGDCTVFRAAHDLDPAYGRALAEAARAGVEVIVMGCSLSERAIVMDRPMKWIEAPGP
jgi:sugar fermentation stimulation protein A